VNGVADYRVGTAFRVGKFPTCASHRCARFALDLGAIATAVGKTLTKYRSFADSLCGSAAIS